MSYAYVKAGQVVSILNSSQAWTDPATEIQHPSTIFSSWTMDEKNAVGLYEVQLASSPDNNFYTSGASSYAFDSDKKIVTETIASKEKNINDVNEVDEDGKAVLDADGKQLVTKGLKTIWLEKTKETAFNLLSKTDWYIWRNTEDNTKAIPSEVTTHRNSVRTACDTIEGKINAVDSLAKLQELFVVPTDSEGKVTGNAPIYNFPKSYGE